jgi:hypothetical protein
LKKNRAEETMAMAALSIPEAKPLSAAAKATLQTNRGAGLGTAMK